VFIRSTRLSASTRGHLYLAAIPLAVMVISRAMSELDDIMADRMAELARLDASIAAQRERLATLAVRGAPEPPPTRDPEPGACYDCDQPAVARTPSGVPVCADHDPAVRLT